MRLKQKKGDIFQLIWLWIIIFFIATIGLFTYVMSHRITTSIANSHVLDSSPEAVKANEFMGKQGRIITETFVFLFFLFGTIAVIIAAAKTNFNPGLLFIYIILLIIAVLISTGLVNIYHGLESSDIMQPEGSQLILTNLILSKYTPLIITSIGGIIIMIMYGKSGASIPL